jgi:hypothetical protein
LLFSAVSMVHLVPLLHSIDAAGLETTVISHG